MSEKKFEIRRPARDFWLKLFRWIILKKLHDYSKRFRSEGLPVMACFSNDFVSNAIFVHGYYEREDLEATALFLNKYYPRAFSGRFVDVGANIGNHTLFFSRYVESTISIEPHPRTFKLLSINVDSKRGQCLNVGVGESAGELFISSPGGNSGRAKVASAETSNSSRVSIETLDTLLQNESNVSLVKIDVEGMEAQVFRGAKNVIEIHRPIILFEQGRKEFNGGSSEAIEILRQYRYNFYRLRRTPAANGRKAGSFVWMRALILRVLSGERIRIVKVDHFEPDAYSMIIAVPGE